MGMLREGAGSLARHPGRWTPESARTRPEAGKAAPSARRGSEAEGADAEAFSRGAETISLRTCSALSSKPLSLQPSYLTLVPPPPGLKVYKQPRLSNQLADAGFRDPGRGPSPWRTEPTEDRGDLLNFEQNLILLVNIDFKLTRFLAQAPDTVSIFPPDDLIKSLKSPWETSLPTKILV